MKAKILFVDNDPGFLAGMQRTLHHEYQVETAAGGEDGLVQLRGDGPYAAVVADLLMPGLDGLGELAARAARSLELSEAWRLEMAAMFCRVGVVSLPTVLAGKLQGLGAEGLTSKEQEVAARIPQMGGELLAHIPRLQDVTRIVRYHQKNFDGTGAPPVGVRGEAIPLEARVLRILVELSEAEARAEGRPAAWAELRRQPKRFDPELLDRLERGLARD